MPTFNNQQKSARPVHGTLFSALDVHMFIHPVCASICQVMFMQTFAEVLSQITAIAVTAEIMEPGNSLAVGMASASNLTILDRLHEFFVLVLDDIRGHQHKLYKRKSGYMVACFQMVMTVFRPIL